MLVFVKEGKHLYVSMFVCADMRVCTYIYMHICMCYIQLTKCMHEYNIFRSSSRKG